MKMKRKILPNAALRIYAIYRHELMFFRKRIASYLN